MRWSVVLALLSSVVALLVGGLGCQTYDFQAVSQGTLSQTEETFPLKPTLKPNLWLLVDRSGSMNSNDACTNGTTCQTRMKALQSAMATFLNNFGDAARMALTFFPASGNDSCASATANAVELPDPTPDDVGQSQTLKAKAAEISTAIAGAAAGGGTPTGLSVQFVGSQPGLSNADDGRDDFILLLTDGLPNCNTTNVYNLCGCVTSPCDSTLVSQCRCTTNSCRTADNCSKGCLDQAGAASQIAALKVKGIRTLVLGFGPDITNGDAPQTLAAMATAGGSNFRTCKNDSDCGSGDSCAVPAGGGSGLCRRQYYKASNANELSEMLAQIIKSIPGDPCIFQLSQGRPDSSKTIAVLVNGQDVRPGPDTWTYSGNNVVFAPTSQYCIDIMAQKPGMTLQVRYVNTL